MKKLFMTYPNGNLEGIKRYYSIHELFQELVKTKILNVPNKNEEENEKKFSR